MTLNLESDPIDPTKWTALQTEVCMRVAHAKIEAFADQADRLAELVRLGLLTTSVAADCLQEAAAYNQLIYEYGADHIQAIMAAAFCEAA